MKLRFELPVDLKDIQVFGNYVMGCPLADDGKTTGGIILHAYHRKRYQRVIVVAVGEGKECNKGTVPVPGGLKAGDIILVDNDYGKEVRFNDVFYILYEEIAILAKIGHMQDNGECEIYAETNI